MDVFENVSGSANATGFPNVTDTYLSTSSLSDQRIITDMGNINMTLLTAATEPPVLAQVLLMNEWEKYLWIVFSPIIFIFGCFGNILNILILFRLKFHKNSTLSLLFVLAFTDIAVLVVGLPRYFVRNAFDGFDLRTVSQFSCKFSLFLIYFTMQLSSWILVLVTVIRFIKTVYPLHVAKGIMSLRKGMVILGIISGFLFFLNLHFFWTNGVTTDDDCGSLTESDRIFDEFYFVYIDFTFLSAIPAIIMIVLNAFILRKIKILKMRTQRRSSVTKQNYSREPISKVTHMLVVTSTYFIVATVPISIYFIVDSYVRPPAVEQGDTLTEARLDLVWTVTFLFQFSHFALNFFLYTATNGRYRKELAKIVKRAKRR